MGRRGRGVAQDQLCAGCAWLMGGGCGRGRRVPAGPLKAEAERRRRPAVHAALRFLVGAGEGGAGEMERAKGIEPS